MKLGEELLDLFDYDLWANLKWIPLCDTDEFRPIMHHLLNAQALWLARVGGPSIEPQPHREWAISLNRAWCAHLAQADLEATVEYANLRGEPCSQSRLRIARHVINHGTYHRGQIRGLYEQLGLGEFPETDLMRYYMER